MKTGKKIAVLLLVFVAAAVIYFIWPMRQKNEEKGSVTYTAMEEASLPVVYPRMLDRKMAPLFGHREEKAVTAGRGSLLVLPEDRKLEISIEEAEDICSLGYEIRSMDTERLIERTELSGWTAENGTVSTVLPIQNLLEEKTEYMLGICADLKDGSRVWYYARIMETDPSQVSDMLALAEEFSRKTFHYDSAQDLTMYMESSPTADNSSFGVVTLKNSFTQMTWGTLGVSQASEPRVTLKELDGSLANIELEYEVEREDEEGEHEYYTVTENFTMKWTGQRIYMMDYERRMNQLFTGGRSLYSGKRILVGISDGEDLYAKKSESGRFTAFVNNRELWSYDSKDGVSARVFAFGGADAGNMKDLRAGEDRHGIEILEVEENGDIDFIVYGYMNRGIHEGWTGVSYNQYYAESNTLEEKFFLPAQEPYEMLKEDVVRLAHKGENGVFYFYMAGAVYGIDLKSHEYIIVASGLNEERFAVSADHSRLAWQENTGLYDSRILHIMDLDTGDKTQIGDGKGDVYRILGFVGNDCVYGVGDAGDYIMSNGRIMGLYLRSLEIVDRNMENAMHYEKSGYYISGVRVDDSRIHIERVSSKTEGFFGAVSEDTLVCNVETPPEKTADIGWYASDKKGRVYFVQLPGDISSGRKIRTVSPKKMVLDEKNEIRPETAAVSDSLQFCAYGRGRYLGSFTSFADAADAAYDCMGFVTAGEYGRIWSRAARPGSSYIRDVPEAVKNQEKYRDSFTGDSLTIDDGLLLEATGAGLNRILSFVSRDIPVRINQGEGRYLYVTGYDQSHVRIWDPVASQSESLAMETAAEQFEADGNDFICWIPEK